MGCCVQQGAVDHSTALLTAPLCLVAMEDIMPKPVRRLVNISRRLKIPLKHLLEYVRFLNGHPTTKLDPSTKRYINER